MKAGPTPGLICAGMLAAAAAHGQQLDTLDRLGVTVGLQHKSAALALGLRSPFDEPQNQRSLLVDVSPSLVGRTRVDVGEALYRHWIGSARTAAGVGVGAAYLRLNTGPAVGATFGSASLHGSDEWNDGRVAPLLALGVRHAAWDSVRLYADAAGIGLNTAGSSWRVFSGAAGVEWLAFRHVGIGLEYGIKELRLTQHGEPARDVEMRVHGPSLFLRGRF